MFEIVPYRYQKGAKVNELSGNFGVNINTDFKHKVAARKAIEAETDGIDLVWKQDKKYSNVRIQPTVKHATMLYQIANQFMSDNVALVIPDELRAASEDPPAIDWIKFADTIVTGTQYDDIEVNFKTGILVTSERGATYPHREQLKEAGFKYIKFVNGSDWCGWLFDTIENGCEPDAIKAELEIWCDRRGLNFNEHNGFSDSDESENNTTATATSLPLDAIEPRLVDEFSAADNIAAVQNAAAPSAAKANKCVARR